MCSPSVVQRSQVLPSRSPLRVRAARRGGVREYRTPALRARAAGFMGREAADGDVSRALATLHAWTTAATPGCSICIHQAPTPRRERSGGGERAVLWLYQPLLLRLFRLGSRLRLGLAAGSGAKTA